MKKGFWFLFGLLALMGCGGGGSSSAPAKWTVIVFMNAANNLEPYARLNVNQMESVAGNPNVRFVIQWKESTQITPGALFNSTRRYLVLPDATNEIRSRVLEDLGPGYDMGSAANMAEFIAWARARFPAERTCVVVWDHGNGWKPMGGDFQQMGFSYDDETGNHIDTWDLPEALGPIPSDILAWDASLMQMLEVADEIPNSTRYIVGSEESPPAPGYPYDAIFAHFRDDPDLPTLTLAQSFVDEFVGDPDYQGEKLTQSVIDPTQLAPLVSATDGLAQALIANVGALGTIAPLVRSQAQKYSDNPVNGHYRDLYDVCAKLADLGAPGAVVTAGQAVQGAIGQAVVYEGHNQYSPGSHGVSIDFSSASQFAPLAQDYQKMRFAQDTQWDEWLTIAP